MVRTFRTTSRSAPNPSSTLPIQNSLNRFCLAASPASRPVVLVGWSSSSAGMNDGGADQEGIVGGGGEGEVDSRARRGATAEAGKAEVDEAAGPDRRGGGASESPSDELEDELLEEEDDDSSELLSSSASAFCLPLSCWGRSRPRAARLAARAGTRGAASSSELESSEEEDESESDWRWARRRFRAGFFLGRGTDAAGAMVGGRGI